MTLGQIPIWTNSRLSVSVAKTTFTSTFYVLSFNAAKQLLCNLVLAKLLGRCHLHSCGNHINHLVRLHAEASPPAFATRLRAHKDGDYNSLHSQP